MTGSETEDAEKPVVAAFRPADERAGEAREVLRRLGVEPVVDPMLAVDSTGRTPAPAEYVIFTSKTGAEIVEEAGWSPDGATIAAIGPRTAETLRAAGYAVDIVPAEYSSGGLVDALDGQVEGRAVTVARSDHGSDRLLDGLDEAGATVRETVLYRLHRPEDAGISAELAAAGRLDAVCFTSSLTVTHFLDAAAGRGVREAAVAGLSDAVVGAIGEPTAETATGHGLVPDVVAPEATFDTLAQTVIDETERSD